MICRFCRAPVEPEVEFCARCGGSNPAELAPPPLPVAAAPPASTPLGLYPMSEGKLLTMSILTLGVYEAWWFYRNWSLRRQMRGAHVMPVWRAIFAPLFAYALFRDVQDEAEAVGVTVAWRMGLRALVYFALNVAGQLPDPFFLVYLATGIPLLDVQATINEVNARRGSPLPLDDRYTTWNRIGIGVGGLLLVLIVVGMFLPAPPPP